MTLRPSWTRLGSRHAAVLASAASHRSILLAAGVLLLAGCSSDSEQRVKAAATATATAHMALAAWLAGDVPATYARRTVKTMREKLANAAEEVAASEVGG